MYNVRIIPTSYAVILPLNSSSGRITARALKLDQFSKNCVSNKVRVRVRTDCLRTESGRGGPTPRKSIFSNGATLEPN